MTKSYSLLCGAVLLSSVVVGCGTANELLARGASEVNAAKSEVKKNPSTQQTQVEQKSSTATETASESEDFRKAAGKTPAAPAKALVGKAAPAPAAPVPAPVVIPQPGFCEILSGARERVYFNPSTSEAACHLTCSSIDATNPFRECSYNGIIFRQTPTAQCLIVGRGGKVHFNALTQPQGCRDACASLEATNPLRTCTWQGLVLRAP